MSSIMQNQEKFKADNPDIYIFLRDNQELFKSNSFLNDMWRQISNKGQLSAGQLTGVQNSMNYLQKKLDLDSLKEKHKDDEPTGSFLGVERKRYDMTLKFLAAKQTKRGFYVLEFTDREGREILAFSNTSLIRTDDNNTLTFGDCFTCRATVNRHTTNNFDPTKKVKQTVLNRIKYNKFLGRKDAKEV